MKKELELCVKSLDSFDSLKDKLLSKGFFIQEDFYLDDIYFISRKNLSTFNREELLSDYILIRNRVGEKIMFVIKRKVNNVINSTKCTINDIESGYKFLEELGYQKLLRLKAHNVLFTNGKNEIYVQDVENLGAYVEMEQKNLKLDNNNGDTIDEMINNLNKYNLNIDKSNYFRKKAYDMLKKIKQDI